MIPVIVTYWRQEQLLHAKLLRLDPRRQRRMETAAILEKVAAAVAFFAWVSTIYVSWPGPAFLLVELAAGVVFFGAMATYLSLRPAARAQVWPKPPVPRPPAPLERSVP